MVRYLVLVLRRLSVLLACLTVVSSSRTARAEDERLVVVVYADPALDTVARRVQVELMSAGHADVVVQRRTAAPACIALPVLDGRPGRVGVRLLADHDGAISAEICSRSGPNRLTVVTSHGRIEEETDFAIVVTEALHGILTGPSGATQAQTDTGSEAQASKFEKGREDAYAIASSLSIDARFVLDAPTGGSWTGIAPSVQLPLSRVLGFRAEGFVSLSPIPYSDAQIDLASHLAWMRIGMFGAVPAGPFRLGWKGTVGLFFNHATAEAVPPRIGGSDGALGAILHAGAFAEFPARGLWFLRGSLGLSTLLPRLRYQMSEDVTPEVGELLVEGGLGVGIRFGN